MGELRINSKKLTPAIIRELVDLCPFSAIEPLAIGITINSGCRFCKLCVKHTSGAIEWTEQPPGSGIAPDGWRGIAVYAEQQNGRLHGVSLELLGKARKLAAVIGHPVYALLVGSGLADAAKILARHGADAVYVCDYPELQYFTAEPYANAFEEFIQALRPSSVLVGATPLGRSLAPRLAARFDTGITADCTVLEMRPDTNLVQIRPAFGGNIMAQICTPHHRPQFCTVRYKVFSPPVPDGRVGDIIPLALSREKRRGGVQVIGTKPKPRQVDLAEAQIVVAAGRGVRSRTDLKMLEHLAELLGGQIGCTRPLVECGWLPPDRQIGLSGRTVNAKLIVTAGISGSVQFAAGMRSSACIVAINSDPTAAIFDIAHYGFAGDLYEVLPRLFTQCGKGQIHV